MAAPFVTGVVALYLSAEKKNGRKPNPTQVLKAISETCRDAGVPGHDERYGWGLVDPHKLLTYEVRALQEGVTIFIPGARIL
jgi:hypothetical protein